MQNVQKFDLNLDPRNRIFIDKNEAQNTDWKLELFNLFLSKTDLCCLASSLLNMAHFSNQYITENTNRSEKFKAFMLSIIYYATFHSSHKIASKRMLSDIFLHFEMIATYLVTFSDSRYGFLNISITQ